MNRWIKRFAVIGAVCMATGTGGIGAEHRRRDQWGLEQHGDLDHRHGARVVE
jgi:hypothetical protein